MMEEDSFGAKPTAYPESYPSQAQSLPSSIELSDRSQKTTGKGTQENVAPMDRDANFAIGSSATYLTKGPVSTIF